MNKKLIKSGSVKLFVDINKTRKSLIAKCDNKDRMGSKTALKGVTKDPHYFSANYKPKVNQQIKYDSASSLKVNHDKL